jgi:hypothetical protein
MTSVRRFSSRISLKSFDFSEDRASNANSCAGLWVFGAGRSRQEGSPSKRKVSCKMSKYPTFALEKSFGGRRGQIPGSCGNKRAGKERTLCHRGAGSRQNSPVRAATGEMALACPVLGMIAEVYADMRGNGAEFARRAAPQIRIVHDMGMVVERDIHQP